MWNYLLIIQIAGILAGVVHSKATNMCRGNNPKCDKGKAINIEIIACPLPADERLWMKTKSEIRDQCSNEKECDISLIGQSVAACCGSEGRIKKPRLRFVYSCPLVEIAPNTTTAPTRPSLSKSTRGPTTPIKHISVTTPKLNSSGDNMVPSYKGFPQSGYCEADICYEKPYCAIGSNIVILNFTNDGEHNWKIMGMIGYYCNKRQNCDSDFNGYSQRICLPDTKNIIHYICMKEKLTSDTDCRGTHTVSGNEGHITSLNYPDMISAELNTCSFQIAFSEAVPVEIFLLDGKNMHMTITKKDGDIMHQNLRQFHTIVDEFFVIIFEVDTNNLREKRFWIYYRILPTDNFHSKPALPWLDRCPETIDKQTTTQFTTTEISKDDPSSPRPEISSKILEVIDSTARTKPAQNPVHTGSEENETDSADKMDEKIVSTKASHYEVITKKVHEKDSMDGDKEKDVTNTNASPSSQRGMFGKEIITGLIAGIVILSCLVIILLTALIASMKRRRRCLAANAEREERSNSGTTNEPLASFQYLKGNFGEGDNDTQNGRSKNSEDNLLGDYSKTGSNSKLFKKKSSLISTTNESGKTMDSTTSKEDNVFHFSKNEEEFPESNYSTQEKNKYPDMGTMKIGDNSFTSRKNSDPDILARKESQESKGDDDVFRDLQHFYVNGDDYALVKKDSRTPKSGLLSDHSSLYTNSSLVPKSNSSGSMHDSDVLEWTKGFNLAV